MLLKLWEISSSPSTPDSFILIACERFTINPNNKKGLTVSIITKGERQDYKCDFISNNQCVPNDPTQSNDLIDNTETLYEKSLKTSGQPNPKPVPLPPIKIITYDTPQKQTPPKISETIIENVLNRHVLTNTNKKQEQAPTPPASTRPKNDEVCRVTFKEWQDKFK